MPFWIAIDVAALAREPARTTRAETSSDLFAQRSERRPELGAEKLRLFPRGEVAALVDLVEVGEAGVDRLDPAARGSPDLAGERREADRNRDRRRSLAGRTGCGQDPSEFPVPPGGRGAGARQPVQRDVVEMLSRVRLPTGSPSTNAREIL